MTNYSVSTVDEFINASQPGAQAHLKELRDIVRKVAVNAEEKIGYGKPYYRYQRYFVGFDTYKNHIGFEILEGRLSEDVRNEAKAQGYTTGNKSLQIRYDQEIPSALIKQIIEEQFQKIA